MTTSKQNLVYLTAIRKSFCVDLWRWMKHESTTILQNHVKGQNSGLNLVKTQQSVGKVMASVFWDAHWIIFIYNLEKGRTITGAYYAKLLDRLVEEIWKKWPHLKKKTILFYDDNASSHISNIAQAKKHELGFESLLHPPDSPGDYYLFSNLKKWLCGRRFESNEEVEWETEGYFGGFDESYYLEGIEKWKDRWTRRIQLKGEYIEK